MEAKLDYLELHLTDSCNLSCKGCSHCAGLNPPNQNIPYNEFVQDLIRIKQLIPTIEKIRLLGGEPFLNPDIEAYLNLTRRLYPAADIRIVTNGLLCLGLPDSVYHTIASKHIAIDISSYPPTMRMKSRLEEHFQRMRVDYYFSTPVTKFGKRLNLQGDSPVTETFLQCNSNWCNFLRHGAISVCPAPSIFDTLIHQYDLAIDTTPYKRNIHDPALTPAELVEWLKKPNGMCAYCTNLVLFDWQLQPHPKLEDWVVKA